MLQRAERRRTRMALRVAWPICFGVILVGISGCSTPPKYDPSHQGEGTDASSDVASAPPSTPGTGGKGQLGSGGRGLGEDGGSADSGGSGGPAGIGGGAGMSVPPGSGGQTTDGLGGSPPHDGAGGDGAGGTTAACGAAQHSCSGMCVNSSSPTTCGAMCDACMAPAGATATCDGSRCDFVCGTTMKKCGTKCTPGCCTDTDCPPQAGKAGKCDASTNACSYDCATGFKPCGAGNCIPTANCCTPSDCPGACKTCNTTSGTCVAVINAADGDSCMGICDATGTCKSKKGQTCQTTAGGCITGATCAPDGYCCDSACGNSCQACDLPGLEGTCTALASGPPHGARATCGVGLVCKGAATGSCVDICSGGGTGTATHCCKNSDCATGRGCATAANLCCASPTEAVGETCAACGASAQACCKLATPACNSGLTCTNNLCVAPCGDGPGQTCCENNTKACGPNSCGMTGVQTCKSGVYGACSAPNTICCSGDITCLNGMKGTCKADGSGFTYAACALGGNQPPPPNNTAACAGTACVFAPTHPISCGGTKVAGSWSFESNTTEGWSREANAPSAATVSSAHPRGTSKIALRTTVDSAYGDASYFDATLSVSPCSTPINLQGGSVSVWVYLEGTAPFATATVTAEAENAALTGLLLSNNVTFADSMYNQWQQLTFIFPQDQTFPAAALSISFDTSLKSSANPNVVAYVDDVVLNPPP